MKQTPTISFADNISAAEAFVFSMRYLYVFFRNSWRCANVFAHRLPWVCIGLSLTASVAVSYVCIASARAERDAALKRQIQLQQQIEQLSVALDARKEAAR